MLIVTAFYDIGREKIKGFERGAKKYLDYFKFWCGVDNELVVYTSKEFTDDILQARKERGRADKTTIIAKDLYSFEPEILEQIRAVFSKYPQTNDRKNSQNIECINADYCYLMDCKMFCIEDAIKEFKLLENGNSRIQQAAKDGILWLDFGFNHGDDVFTDKEQFDFTLIPQNLDNSKITLFRLENLDNYNLAQIYFNMKVGYIGSLIYGGINAWLEFSADIKNAIKAFLSLQIMDDDQPLFLWCARNNPKNYDSRDCKVWFDSLFYFIPKELRKDIKTIKIPYYKNIKENAKNLSKKDRAVQILKYFYYKFINKKYYYINSKYLEF